MPRRAKNQGANRASIGKYEVLEKLGTGGFAAVWKARDPDLNRVVAIKELHPTPTDEMRSEVVRRFRREAQILSDLGETIPEAVPQVFDFFALDDGRALFLVEQYLQGSTLDRKCREKGPFPPLDTIRWLLAIAAALAKVHGQRVAHRDLGPQNIQVLDAGGVRIIDFGLARQDLDPTPRTVRLEFGTPGYCPPEPDREQPADIYALGAICYRLLTNATPSEMSREALVKALNTACLMFPTGLRQVLVKSLRKRPESRPTAQRLVEELAAGERAMLEAVQTVPLYPGQPVPPDPVEPALPDPVEPALPDPVEPALPDLVEPALPDPVEPAPPDAVEPAPPDAAEPVPPDAVEPVPPDPFQTAPPHPVETPPPDRPDPAPGPPPRAIGWLVPIVLLLLIAAAGVYFIDSNERPSRRVEEQAGERTEPSEFLLRGWALMVDDLLEVRLVASPLVDTQDVATCVLSRTPAWSIGGQTELRRQYTRGECVVNHALQLRDELDLIRRNTYTYRVQLLSDDPAVLGESVAASVTADVE